jgi:putative Mg2+ transporter-C (MgtC) family protein
MLPIIPTLTETILRLTTAMLVGCAIGLNRDLRGKPAGLRTHALVTIGSALLAMTSIHIALTMNGSASDAVSRVIQGIVTGIGFLGAGVIIRDHAGHVRGLTTAATIWVAASLGIACGIGYWPAVAIAVALVFIVLLIGGPLEQFVGRIFGRPDSEQS